MGPCGSRLAERLNDPRRKAYGSPVFQPPLMSTSPLLDSAASALENALVCAKEWSLAYIFEATPVSSSESISSTSSSSSPSSSLAARPCASSSPTFSFLTGSFAFCLPLTLGEGFGGEEGGLEREEGLTEAVDASRVTFIRETTRTDQEWARHLLRRSR